MIFDWRKAQKINMEIINRFLLWLEEHQIGLLTTIAVHLLIISLILVMKIRINIQREQMIMLNVSHLQTIMEEENRQQEQQGESQVQMSAQEFVQSMMRENNIRNIPVNTAEARAVENIEKMVRDIKTQENITDRPSSQDTHEEKTLKDDRLSENEARIYDEKYPVNSAGERTIYKGATTVYYELSDRHHIYIPLPVYKCRVGGTIAVNIVVNGNGYVIAAEINKSKSNSEDPCIVEEAKRSAERSRFNSSSLAKQQGSITFIFQAQ